MSEMRNPHGGYIEDNNLFPFRTEKLNTSEPMVLHCNVGELVAAKGVCKVLVWTKNGTGTLSLTKTKKIMLIENVTINVLVVLGNTKPSQSNEAVKPNMTKYEIISLGLLILLTIATIAFGLLSMP